MNPPARVEGVAGLISGTAKDYTPLFLSPYSPEFQPVELAFSKIKGLFRRLVTGDGALWAYCFGQ